MAKESLQITVFDFSPEDCVQTAKIILAYCEEQGLPVKVEQFTKIQPFVLYFRRRCAARRYCDMVFVGVDSIIGMEVARNIRSMDDLFPLFFISHSGNDYALEAFRLRALQVSTGAVEICLSRTASSLYASRKPLLLQDWHPKRKAE